MKGDSVGNCPHVVQSRVARQGMPTSYACRGPYSPRRYGADYIPGKDAQHGHRSHAAGALYIFSHEDVTYECPARQEQASLVGWKIEQGSDSDLRSSGPYAAVFFDNCQVV